MPNTEQRSKRRSFAKNTFRNGEAKGQRPADQFIEVINVDFAFRVFGNDLSLTVPGYSVLSTTSLFLAAIC